MVLEKLGMTKITCQIVASYLPFGFLIKEMDCRAIGVSRAPTFRILTHLDGKVINKTVLTFSTVFPRNTIVKMVSGTNDSEDDVFEHPYAIYSLFVPSFFDAEEKFYE